MGSGGVAIAALPTVICLKVPFSDSLGGVILDCCMGSGTTAIAAMIEHRHFIGYETDKDYYSRALKRIEEQKTMLSFDFTE